MKGSNAMEISVIMPVFNAGKFLKDAIDSVLNQTFTDFELILIDDGSTDGSEMLCDQYKNIDNRVVVIHQKNGGICKARNEALKISRGKYIAFCDHDDLLKKILLEDTYKLAEDNDADIVKFNIDAYFIKENGESNKIKYPILKSFIMEIEQTAECYKKYKATSHSVWNGLYRASIIKDNNIWFNEFMRYGVEDTEFSLKLFKVARKIVVTENSYYIHFKRDGISTSSKFNPNRLESEKMLLQYELEVIRNLKGERNLYLEYEAFCITLLKILDVVTYSDCKLRINEKIDQMKALNKIKCGGKFFKVITRDIKIRKKYVFVYALFKLRLYYLLIAMMKIKKRLKFY